MRLETIPAELSALLGARLPEADIYPAGAARDPFAKRSRPSAAVSLQKIEAGASALGDCWGEQDGVFLNGKRAAVTVALALWAKNEAECQAICGKLCRELLFLPDPAVEALTCGEAEYRTPQEACRMGVTARFSLLLTSDEHRETAESIRLKLTSDGHSPNGQTPILPERQECSP